MKQKALTEIICGLMDTTMQPQAWDGVCDRVTDLFGATAFMVFEYDLICHKSPNFFGSECMRGPGYHIIDAMLKGEVGKDKEAYDRFPGFERSKLIPEYKIWSVRHDLDIPDNKFREKVLKSFGSRSRSVARLNEIGPWMDVAAVHMPCFGSDIPQDVFDNAEFLFPLISKTLETNRVVKNLTQQYGMLLDEFDLLECGAAFCTPQGRIILANRHLKEMLEDGDAVVAIGNGVVEAAVASDRVNLRSAFVSAVEHRSSPESHWLQLNRRSGRSPIVAKVAQVGSKELEWRKDQIVLLLLADPEDEKKIHAEGLAAFGLLTPSELDVCRWLLKGVETGEISERRSTSIETTRSHIKSATAKMACRTRLDLLRIAIATSLPRTQQIKTHGKG